MFVLSCFSHVRVCLTLWTVARQAPLSMGFSRQYWSELPCPPPGSLPDPGVASMSHTSCASASGFFTTSATWEAHSLENHHFLTYSLIDIHPSSLFFPTKYQYLSELRVIWEILMTSKDHWLLVQPCPAHLSNWLQKSELNFFFFTMTQ